MNSEDKVSKSAATASTYREPASGTTDTLLMCAIVQDEYGEAGDVLRLEHIERPSIGADEVLVRVRAAGVDRGVWHLMAGLPYPVRLAGFGVRAPKTRVRGSDVAGIVDSVGADVTGLRPGDEVFGFSDGSFAEYARCSAAKIAPKPASLSFEQAAAVPVSAITALQAVRDNGHVRAGQKVLVIGASGGVGSFAVQIARAFGADVTGVCSTEKTALVRSLGADRVLDYTREDFAADGPCYDVIIDTGGNAPLRRIRRALTAQGTLVIVGAETGGRFLGGTDRQLRAIALSLFAKQKLGAFISSENRDDLLVLTSLIDSGAVTPAVDRAFSLDGVPEAIRYLQEGRASGKVVITVSAA